MGTIFGQILVKKRKFRFFDQKWTLEVKNRFLVKKSKFEFFDQNLPKNGLWRSKIDFWSKNQNLSFLTKICPKMASRGLKSILVKKRKFRFLTSRVHFWS